MLLATAVSVVVGLQETLGGLRHLQVDVPATVVHGGELELAHVAAEQAMLVSRFRTLVIVVVVVFLVLINASVLVLLRGAAMILQPVERLTEAARHLNEDRFDYRLEWDREDEFGELARAYNNLAGQLQTSERGKLETLGQVARALNHDLNNAISVIELQLQLLSRKTSGGPVVEQYARQIRDGLARMAATVESLKHVRRIVLTDYVSGVKMLDLERSVLVEQQAPGAVAKATAGGPVATAGAGAT
jgi:nitrate/nitrite-specific signal transduction histidine kinase